MQTDLKPLINDGMSQSERYLLSLEPSYFKIDEKDTTDLLKFTVELASQFNYYNFLNKIDGNWEDFFTSDLDVLLALISKFDVKQFSIYYEKLSEKVLYAESEEHLTAGMKELFHFIYTFATIQIKYHLKFGKINNNDHSFEYLAIIEGFRSDLRLLNFYNQKARDLLGDSVEISISNEFLSPPAEVDERSYDPFGEEGTTREKAIHSLTHLEKLFSDLSLKYLNLLAASRQLLEEQQLDGTVYDPHIGLFISFLKLYPYVQHSMNHLVKKHLDFYYQQIIGIKFREEIADKVHLVLEPVITVHQLTLQKGEELFAEIEGKQEKLLYKLDDDVEISRAQIRELKTVFVSNQVQHKAKVYNQRDVHEMQVYQGNYPVRNPATLVKERTLVEPWPLLGEDQAELSINEMSMEAADIGLLISSPILYQADGYRYVELKIFITKDSFIFLHEHVKNYSAVTGTDSEVLLMDMLYQSFNISITGELGWVDIYLSTVTYQSDNRSDPYIEIKFVLNHREEPVHIYNKLVHGNDYGLKWPVVRLLLNNTAFHNPYTIFSNLFITRINIKVEVKESKSFKLKNNFGDLYAAAAFQPFGPTPSIGSYLDIKNTNIFNRYTKDFSLRIQWLDLPKEKGGFKTYYEGYDTEITNESFKVRLDGTADTKVLTTTDDQQVFNLFDSYKEESRKGCIKSITEIKGIDSRQIRFDNMMGLEDELNKSEISFKEGTVRLELIEPPDAFGHRKYPQVFTDTIMHNSKRFVQKHAVPNQPYIPVVKALSIDYTLEHTEQLVGMSKSATEETMYLIHLNPYGYNKIYPGRALPGYPFVTKFDQFSNLFIGLSELIPLQELSILFELEENNFHHTLHEPEEINWSYLVNNEWIPINKSAVYLDTTNKFVNSGIIKLQVPHDIETKNTILNKELYWIRASLPGSSAVKSRLISVFTNAVIAVRMPGQEQLPGTSFTLPSRSIKSFKRKMPDIQNVWQLFPSFNGQPKETYQQFNVRVSERLRHKQRLITTLDISQAILNEFPGILMVKCFGSQENNNMIIPGTDIQVIVIPKERDDGGLISQEPKVNLEDLFQIKNFINPALSDFIQVEIGNPIYEKVMVVASVQFVNTGKVAQSQGYLLKLFNEDIKKHISPWHYDSGQAFEIGSKIYVSEMLNYLQNRPYVAYITEFSMVHFYKVWDKFSGDYLAKIIDTSVDKVESLSGSVPGAILVSVEEHLVNVLDQPAFKDPRKAGVSDLIIGSGLLVNQEREKTGDKATTVPAQKSCEDLYDFTIYID